ncbi:hypothetical protein [Streptomyces chartreusis]|uniref:hypothetical protein n=1 Tax=Streptomyces chartreusis TaxID=1969 RepID=UPI0036337E73
MPTHHTDTDHTTVLHIPDLDLVVAGDAVYNDVHLYLSEGANGGFAAHPDRLNPSPSWYGAQTLLG